MSSTKQIVEQNLKRKKNWQYIYNVNFQCYAEGDCSTQTIWISLFIYRFPGQGIHEACESILELRVKGSPGQLTACAGVPTHLYSKLPTCHISSHHCTTLVRTHYHWHFNFSIFYSTVYILNTRFLSQWNTLPDTSVHCGAEINWHVLSLCMLCTPLWNKLF